MKCDAEKVTGYVDAVLGETERAELDVHLAECTDCREQAAAEGRLRERLKELAPRELPDLVEARVRRRLRPQRRLLRYVAPLAASLLALLWARGAAPIVAWELARDHDACYSHSPLPAKIWSHRADEVMAWFEEQGTRLPLVPDEVGGLRLVGARFCPLPSMTHAPHLYYASEEATVSLFVVPHSVRFRSPLASRARGKQVRLLTVAGTVVGVVGSDAAHVDAFTRAFTVMTVRQAPETMRLPAGLTVRRRL